jgi:hypothetical protein
VDCALFTNGVVKIMFPAVFLPNLAVWSPITFQRSFAREVGMCHTRDQLIDDDAAVPINSHERLVSTVTN